MKALQKKQVNPHNGTPKLPKNNKALTIKKSKEADIINNMVFSEYEVWPILSELYKRQN